MNNIPNFNY